MKRLALLVALAAPGLAAAGESGLVIFHTQCSRCMRLTPSGVPVAMMSPGSRVMTCEM